MGQGSSPTRGLQATLGLEVVSSLAMLEAESEDEGVPEPVNASNTALKRFYSRQAACSILCGSGGGGITPLSKLEVKPRTEKNVKGRYGELIGASVGFSHKTMFGFQASINTNVSGYEEHEEKHFNADGGYNKSEHRHDFFTESHVSPYAQFGFTIGASVNAAIGLRRRRRSLDLAKGGRRKQKRSKIIV
ncbi:unnamed protein product [Orchesella dallaii]|uniref:Uncharacterized protein n=1 Tax=Orchesella dallaii TaxID=48710 RepID=A0ABP1RVR5_9HEXA